MTYAALTQVSQPASFPSDPYIPSGTDAAEAAHWRAVMGSEDVDYDPREDLEEMGLIK